MFRITKNVMGACESVCLCFIVVQIVASFFKNTVLNHLEKATLTHPSPKYTMGISSFGVIEQMKLNAWLMCSLWRKNQFLAASQDWFKDENQFWIIECWTDELLPCNSNVMFQISWLRILETMEVAMMWALL